MLISMQFVPAGSPVTTPRHSIQFSGRASTSPRLSPMVTESRCSSRSSKRLSTQQAILIAKVMGCRVDDSGAAEHQVRECESPGASTSIPLTPASNVKTMRGTRSTSSLASAYYTPLQTTPSRTVDDHSEEPKGMPLSSVARTQGLSESAHEGIPQSGNDPIKCTPCHMEREDRPKVTPDISIDDAGDLRSMEEGLVSH